MVLQGETPTQWYCFSVICASVQVGSDDSLRTPTGQWEYAFTEGYKTTSRKGSPYTVFEAQYHPTTTQAMLLPAAPPAAMSTGITMPAQVYQPPGMRQVQPPPGPAAAARPYQPAVDAVESSEDEDDEAEAAPQVVPTTSEQRPSRPRPQQGGSTVSKAKHNSPQAIGAKMRAEKGLQFNSKKKVQGWLSDIGERE